MPAGLRTAPTSLPLPPITTLKRRRSPRCLALGAAMRWSLAATHGAGWLLAEADGVRLDREGRYRCAG